MTITTDRPVTDDAAPTPSPVVEQSRLRLRSVTAESVLTLAGAFLAGLALVWVLYERVLPLSGAAGFWVCVVAATVLFYAIASWSQVDGRFVTDRVVRLLLVLACVAVLAVVLDVGAYTVFRGVDAIFHANFWTQTMVATGPLQPLTSGGMVHALVGSLEQLGLATLFSVPLGITAALYLVEMGGPLARVVRTITEAMTALPEIVAGLFVYALFVITLGLPRSGFAAALALTVMMIPVVTRTSEVVLRLVPGTLREASYALGASQAATVLRIVLPTARSGLSTAVILAMARAVGETSPVLLTAGFTKALNANPFSGDQTSLPLYIFTYVRYPQSEMVARAFGAGLALMIMVLVLFAAARLIGGRAPGELSGRQRRRLGRTTGPRGPVTPPVDVPVVMAPGYPDPTQ